MAFLLTGLGNPGKEYAGNRHNVGFMVADVIAEAYRFGAWKKNFGGQIADGMIGSEKAAAFKPMSYMNVSGAPVSQAAGFYKIPPEHVIVFHDELDLPLGKIRVKKGGGHGGHNGLKSLDSHIGKDYWRVRIGIAHPGDKDMVSDYVLSDFRKEERKIVEDVVIEIVRNVDFLLAGNEAGFMNKLSLSMREA